MIGLLLLAFIGQFGQLAFFPLVSCYVLLEIVLYAWICGLVGIVDIWISYGGTFNDETTAYGKATIFGIASTPQKPQQLQQAHQPQSQL